MAENGGLLLAKNHLNLKLYIVMLHLSYCDCLWQTFWVSEGLRLKSKFHIVSAQVKLKLLINDSNWWHQTWYKRIELDCDEEHEDRQEGGGSENRCLPEEQGGHGTGIWHLHHKAIFYCLLSWWSMSIINALLYGWFNLKS